MSPSIAVSVPSVPCISVRSTTYCANNITQIYYGGVPIPTANCDLTICSLLLSHWGYLPNVPGNAFFVAVFFILLAVNVPLGIMKKTWGPLAALTVGCLFEGVGTIGRILANGKPFLFMNFLIYLIFLTIGPAFLSAAIYFCLSRIVVVYGKENSRFKPQTYSIVFMCSDLVCLILQGAGGGLAAVAGDDKVKAQKGINVMIAGLSWQVASLTLFAIAAADIAWHVRGASRPLKYQALRSSTKFKGFLWALGIATALIYIRSVYRVAELSEGFTGSIADQEIPYMIFEPVLISIACIVLIVWHPGIVFGELWHTANPRAQTSEKDTLVQDASTNRDFVYPTNPNHRFDLHKSLPPRPVSLSSSSGKTLAISVMSEKERKQSIIDKEGRWYISHEGHCPHHPDSRANSIVQSRNGSMAQWSDHHGHNHMAPNYQMDTNAKTPLLRHDSHGHPEYQNHNHNHHNTSRSNRRSDIYSFISARTAPLQRQMENLRTPPWTSSHQAQHPRSAALPRTPRGQSQYEDRMRW